MSVLGKIVSPFCDMSESPKIVCGLGLHNECFGKPKKMIFLAAHQGLDKSVFVAFLELEVQGEYSGPGRSLFRAGRMDLT